MTIGIDLEETTPARRWAFDHLGLAASLDLADVRQHLQQSLAKHAFVPEPGTALAWSVLAHSQHLPLAKTEFAYGTQRDRVHEQIKKLVAEFWDLEPSQRQTRIEALKVKCSYPGLRLQLERLGSAASLTRVPESPSLADQIARRLQDLLLLPPLEGARAKQKLLQDCDASWGSACHELKAKHPELAEYFQGLLETLGKADAKAANSRCPAARMRVTTTALAKPVNSSSWAQSHWLWIGAIVAAIRIIAMLASSNRSVPKPDYDQYNNRIRYNNGMPEVPKGDPALREQELERILKNNEITFSGPNSEAANKEFRESLKYQIEELKRKREAKEGSSLREKLQRAEQEKRDQARQKPAVPEQK